MCTTLPPRTTSARLTMRPWQPGDAPALCAAIAASLEHLRPWMPWATAVPTVHEERELIGSFEGCPVRITGVVLNEF